VVDGLLEERRSFFKRYLGSGFLCFRQSEKKRETLRADICPTFSHCECHCSSCEYDLFLLHVNVIVRLFVWVRRFRLGRPYINLDTPYFLYWFVFFSVFSKVTIFTCSFWPFTAPFCCCYDSSPSPAALQRRIFVSAATNLPKSKLESRKSTSGVSAFVRTSARRHTLLSMNAKDILHLPLR
jgi:hypothetical protein